MKGGLICSNGYQCIFMDGMDLFSTGDMPKRTCDRWLVVSVDANVFSPLICGGYYSLIDDVHYI
jgi:hypothetical protein